jgi:hypothetical protein
MVEVISVLYSILYTIKSLILYSLLVTLALLILYLPGYGLFKLFSKKFSWNISSLLATYIVTYVFVAIIYFVPYWFLGFQLKGYEQNDAKFLFFLALFGMFLLYALFLTLFSQLFIFLGAYLTEKFKFKSFLLKLVLAMFIIALILNILVMIFPWILGGIVNMIYI